MSIQSIPLQDFSALWNLTIDQGCWVHGSEHRPGGMESTVEKQQSRRQLHDEQNSAV